MNVATRAAVALTAMALLLGGCAAGTTKKPSQALAHVDHVAKSWTDTPGQQGLLAVLEKEARIAAQHAGFAASKPDDADWMLTHIRHVRHAVDPSSEKGGPGLGYGLIRAAEGVARHMRLAAAAPDASENIKLHAVHVATAAENVVSWGNEIMILSDGALAEEKAKRIASFARGIRKLTGQILDGRDIDGDGKVTWQVGEGGVAQAKLHLQLLLKGEGR